MYSYDTTSDPPLNCSPHIPEGFIHLWKRSNVALQNSIKKSCAGEESPQTLKTTEGNKIRAPSSHSTGKVSQSRLS